MNLKPEDKEAYEREASEARIRLYVTTTPEDRERCLNELSAIVEKYREREIPFEGNLDARRRELETDLIIAAQNLVTFMGCSACQLKLEDGRIVEIREPDDGK